MQVSMQTPFFQSPWTSFILNNKKEEMSQVRVCTESASIGCSFILNVKSLLLQPEAQAIYKFGALDTMGCRIFH
jgi:hypothetical protein